MQCMFFWVWEYVSQLLIYWFYFCSSEQSHNVMPNMLLQQVISQVPVLFCMGGCYLAAFQKVLMYSSLFPFIRQSTLHWGHQRRWKKGTWNSWKHTHCSHVSLWRMYKARLILISSRVGILTYLWFQCMFIHNPFHKLFHFYLFILYIFLCVGG